MIAATPFAGKNVGVLGLARSGIAVARALMEGGARVVAWDDNEKARESAAASGVPLIHAQSWDYGSLSSVVLSPGIPLTHPKPHDVVVAAQRAKVEVIGDIEVFVRTIKAAKAAAPKTTNGNGNGYRHANGNGAHAAPAPIICITGTNGKSTTTQLIGHILSRCGYDAQIGGNIGRAVFDLAAPRDNTVYVLETSSYQLDLTTQLKPDVAVFINITNDHLDRHGTMANYVAAKRKIFAGQGAGDLAIVGVDDTWSAETCMMLRMRGGIEVVPVSVGQVIGGGMYAIGGHLYDGTVASAQEIADVKQIPTLPGAHNWQNAAMAYAACKRFVRDPKAIIRAMASFEGLNHRMEQVGSIGKVRFVNDSKATNADAAAKALICYDGIYWIVGGKAKDGGIGGLSALFPRITKAYLIGDATEAFAKTLDGRVPFEKCGTLENAVKRASADAAQSPLPHPVVLLSPACASFDQFRDFEDRGDHFRKFALGLGARKPQEASAA